MQTLTEKQKIIFDYIREFIEEKGVAPSVREIGKAVGLKSTSSVQYNLDALEEAGYIQRDPNLKRTIRLAGQYSRSFSVPLVGMITAGKPILAVETIEDYIPVAIRKKSGDMFALRVKGDSMVNAAILDGDIVVVDRAPIASNGDIIVALIDDEATVKRFYKENGRFRLQPENDAYEPIVVKELTVLGKVISVIRNYD